jgi:hypothetical protein
VLSFRISEDSKIPISEMNESPIANHCFEDVISFSLLKRTGLKGTMEKLTLLRDFWPKLRDMRVFFVRFWFADVKLVVEHE